MLTVKQDYEIPGLHYRVLGLHLAVPERSGELVLCCESVERWRDDRDAFARDSVSILLCEGA